MAHILSTWFIESLHFNCGYQLCLFTWEWTSSQSASILNKPYTYLSPKYLSHWFSNFVLFEFLTSHLTHLSLTMSQFRFIYLGTHLSYQMDSQMCHPRFCLMQRFNFTSVFHDHCLNGTLIWYIFLAGILFIFSDKTFLFTSPIYDYMEPHAVLPQGHIHGYHEDRKLIQKYTMEVWAIYSCSLLCLFGTVKA